MESRGFRRSGEPRPVGRKSGERRVDPLAPSVAATSPPGEEARTAALMRQSTIPRKAALVSSSSPKKWEQEVIKFDREGPGVLGYYLDTLSLMASMCPLFVEEKNTAGQWERSTDPVLALALGTWKGNIPQLPQSELVFRAVRAREAIGRCWHIKDPELGWNVAAMATPTPGFVDWTTMYGTPRRTPDKFVHYSWVPDTYEPHKPTSPVRRALSDLKRLNAVVRNQTRSAESRLLMNGLLAFDVEDGSTPRPLASPVTSDGETTELTGIDEIVDDFMDMARLAFRDDDSPAAHIPFPYIGKPAQLVDLGGQIDSTTLDVERIAIEAFARAVNFPQQLLTQGPGSANHWNEYLLQETQVRLALAPKLSPICDEVTVFSFRPAVETINERMQGVWYKDPARCRVAADVTFLLQRPRQVSEMMEAYRLGAVSRLAVAEAIGETDMLDLPRGMTEFEFWELSNHISGAPYAEVSPEGDLIIPPPPPDPSMMGEAPAGFALGAGAPPGEIGAGATPTVDLPAGPNGNPVSEPPMPPAMTAAVSDQPDRIDADRLYASAEDGDKRLEAALTALAAVIVAAANTEINRRVILATPAQTPERAALRALPDAKVWAAASPEARNKVDPNAVFAETVEKYRPQIEAAIADTEQSFIRKWGPPVAAGIVAGAAVTGAAAFGAALAGWYADTFAKGATHTAKLPARAVRFGMAAAGGAQVTADGSLTLSAGDTPIPQRGGEWEGGYGFLTGDTMVHQISELAGTPPVVWEWIHGFYGEPETPFPPHVALDGQRFNSPADVPNGLHINDHRGCRCSWKIHWST